MKKVLVVMMSLLLFGFVAASQAADDQMPAKSGPDMPMMNCPMMKGMNGDKPMGGMMMNGRMHPMMMQHGMMMHDMMQMMKDIMVIEKKILTSPKPEEAVKMQSDLDAMISKMDKMMTSQQCMMMNMPKPAGDQKKEEKPAEHKH